MRAATKRNPRSRTCPTCKRPNVLTPKDVALGYQCNQCEDLAAVAIAIRDLSTVPAGHLYASVMGQMTLDEFEWVIAYIIDSDLATRDASHLLTWTGPAKVSR